MEVNIDGTANGLGKRPLQPKRQRRQEARTPERGVYIMPSNDCEIKPKTIILP